MKLIAQVKLQPTEEQADALKRTIKRANEACNYLSARAWESKTFRQYSLHKLAYYDTREKFPDLSSQVVVRAIARVADTYKLDRKRKRSFKPLGAIPYDQRILSWKTKDKQGVSIWSVEGRLHIEFVCGDHQREMLENRLGQADLVYRDGMFFLHQCCEVETPDPDDPDGWLGVDLGIVNIAVTSDGEMFSGEQLEAKRQWYERRRAILQSVGTKSAKRRLKQIKGRQSRFQTWVNHNVSKAIVEKAARHNLGIAIEDLTGIRERTTVRRSQRSRHHNWPYYQLRSFIQYKSELHGVPLKTVDPAYTSQTCSVCGHVSRSNRVSRDKFVCSVCGYSANADRNAALNIARRADVNTAMVSPDGDKGLSTIASPLEVRDNAPLQAAG